MLFDPEKRQAKYRDLWEIARTRGFHAEVTVGEAEPDALLVWEELGASALCPSHGRFWIHGRRRGWFLGVSGPRRYLIPNRDSVQTITLNLATAMREGRGKEALAGIIQEFGLVPVADAKWHQEEGEEQQLGWEDYGWTALHQIEEALVWDEFTDRLLRPGGSLHIPTPAVTWIIPDLLDPTSQASLEDEGLLTLTIFDALRQVTSTGEYVLALNWDHPCYRFFPHRGVRKAYRDYWAVPVWPRGDSHHFVAPGFEHGILATWAGEIHVFGQTLIEEVNDSLTKLLGPPKA